MRIAIILDPFPTRGVASVLATLGEQFIDLCNQDSMKIYETAILCSGSLANDLRMRRPNFLTYFGGHAEDRDRFADQLTDWDDEALAVWRCVNAGDEGWTEHYYRWVDGIVTDEFDFDIAFTWGNNKSLINGVRKTGKPIIALELGPLRAPVAKLLVYGINQVPSEAGVGSMDVAHLLSSPAPSSLYELRSEISRFRGGKDYFEDDGDWHSPISHISAFETVTRRVLYVCQLWDDSNTAFWTDDEEINLKSLIDMTRSRDIQLIIKPHPATRITDLNEMRLRRLRGLWAGERHVVELPIETVNSSFLLGSVHAVVSANSSVIFEAMLRSIPSFAFGRSYFVPAGGMPSLLETVEGTIDPERWKSICLAVCYEVLKRTCIEESDFFNGRSIPLLTKVATSYDSSWRGLIFSSSEDTLQKSVFHKFGVYKGSLMKVSTVHKAIRIDDGRVFNVVEGEIFSNFDSISDDEEYVYLRGWAFGASSRSPCSMFILQLDDERFLITNSANPRLDVAHHFGEEDVLYGGFYLRLRPGDLSRAHIANIYAYVGNGRVEKLKSGGATIPRDAPAIRIRKSGIVSASIGAEFS